MSVKTCFQLHFWQFCSFPKTCRACATSTSSSLDEQRSGIFYVLFTCYSKGNVTPDKCCATFLQQNCEEMYSLSDPNCKINAPHFPSPLPRSLQEEETGSILRKASDKEKNTRFVYYRV